jgi:hypothetical protein
LSRRAGVAELADAAGLGPVGRKPLEVQILSPALLSRIAPRTSRKPEGFTSRSSSLTGFPGRRRAARLGTLVAEADALAGRLGILVTGASGGIFVLAPLGRGVLFLGLRGRLVAHKSRGYRSSLTSASGYSTCQTRR